VGAGAFAALIANRIQWNMFRAKRSQT